MLVMATAFISGCGSTTSTPVRAFGTSPGSGFLSVWNHILWFGTLGFLGGAGENPLVGFMRILVVVVVTVALAEGARLIGLTGGLRWTLAIILALISGVFIPGSILTGIGASYGTLVAFILIGIPIGLGGWGYFQVPATTRFWILLRIGILILILFLLFNMKGHATALMGVPGGPAWFRI